MQAISVHTLQITVISVVSLAASPNLGSFELIYMIDSTTEQTGSITLQCRDAITAESLHISQISFFLNRSSAADPSLRERGDIRVAEVGSTAINFNLTRRLEGRYTCGNRVDCTNLIESPPRLYICKLQVY